MSELLCPKCGATSDEKDFIESFCVDCYPVKITCPTKLRITQCNRCEKIRISGEWIKFSRKAISDYVVRKCKGNFDSGEFDMDEQIAEFKVGKDGSTATIKKRIILEMEPTLCLFCSRASGGYFQGIIQLRGNERRIEKWADMIYGKLKNKTFIAKEEEKHGGLDIYVGSSKAVVELLSEMKVKATITTKLAGVEQGKRYYRTTFLIRL